MQNKSVKRIYVDCNVLVNYCTSQNNDVVSLKYIFKQRRKEQLFTSSLAIVQTISALQKKNKNRKAYSRDDVTEKLNEILGKFTILDLSYNDIKTGFNLKNDDVEDSVHYALSQKVKCDAILTNNVKDFVYFSDVKIIAPVLQQIKTRIH